MTFSFVVVLVRPTVISEVTSGGRMKWTVGVVARAGCVSVLVAGKTVNVVRPLSHTYGIFDLHGLNDSWVSLGKATRSSIGPSSFPSTVAHFGVGRVVLNRTSEQNIPTPFK